MTLRTASLLQDTPQSPVQWDGGPGWRQISAGLRLAAYGYQVLIVGGVLGVALVWLTCAGHVVPAPGLGREAPNLLPLLAAATLALTAVLSYALMLAGQWRCLMYAPQRNSAKELMYVCFHCLVIGAVLNAVGALLDGGNAYAALQRGWQGLRELDPYSAGSLMQGGSALLGLIGSLVFSQFLRNVAECFNDRRRARAVDLNLCFMGLLVGGSVGAHFCVQRLTLKGDALPWLVGGWLLCVAWHLLLVRGVRRCVEDGLCNAVSARVAPPPAGGVGVALTYTLSGLHRLARNASV